MPSGHTITFERMEETEQLLGVVFPAAFKARMARANGGDLPSDDDGWWLYPFRDTTDRRLLKKTFQDIVRNTESQRSAGLDFPPDGVAIANNGCGDYLLFLPEEPGALGPAVWIWGPITGFQVQPYVDHVMELWVPED